MPRYYPSLKGYGDALYALDAQIVVQWSVTKIKFFSVDHATLLTILNAWSQVIRNRLILRFLAEKIKILLMSSSYANLVSNAFNAEPNTLAQTAQLGHLISSFVVNVTQ